MRIPWDVQNSTHAPTGLLEERVYDERGRVIEAIDANGDSTLYTYTYDIDLETWNRIGHRADGELIASAAL